MNDHDRAIDAAMNFSADGDEYHIVNHHSAFLDGSLYVVGFKAQNGENHSFVYIENGNATVLKNQALLNEFVARKSAKKGFPAIMESLGGIAGVIGVLITLAIIYLAIQTPRADIPEILSTALTAILGFYFGSKTNKS